LNLIKKFIKKQKLKSEFNRADDLYFNGLNYLYEDDSKQKGIEILNQSIAICDAILSKEMYYEDALHLKIEILIDLEKISEAKNIINSILSRESKNSRALLSLANTYAIEKEFNRAIEYCKNILQEDKKYYDAIDMLINIYNHLKNKKETLKYIDLALKGPAKNEISEYLKDSYRQLKKELL